MCTLIMQWNGPAADELRDEHLKEICYMQWCSSLSTTLTAAHTAVFSVVVELADRTYWYDIMFFCKHRGYYLAIYSTSCLLHLCSWSFISISLIYILEAY